MMRSEVYSSWTFMARVIYNCIRQPAMATGPDHVHLTDDLGNICKVTTTGCHGIFHALNGSSPSQMFSGLRLQDYGCSQFS